MGNTALCLSLAPVTGGGGGGELSTSSSATKVIHADGTVTRLARPVRASELMRDHPGQFVCDSARLAVGCRVPGVAADEFLRPRHAYFLLPMDMLYSVLTDDEMAALSDSHAATAAASAWKRIVTGATARGRDHHHHHDGSRGANRQSKDGNNGNDCGGAKVYPMLGLLEAGDLGAGDDKPERPAAGVGKSRPAAAGMIRRHRPWQPALDTIEEVP